MTNETHVMSLSVLMNEAISIAVSTLGSDAREMAGHLAEYIVDQAAFATGGAA